MRNVEGGGAKHKILPSYTSSLVAPIFEENAWIHFFTQSKINKKINPVEHVQSLSVKFKKKDYSYQGEALNVSTAF